MGWIRAVRKIARAFRSVSGSSGYRSPPPDVAFDSTDFEIEAVDGDTIRVSGVPRTIRLARVNTPEHGQPGCHEATEFVRRALLEAERVEIVGGKAGKYGRYIAEIEVDGENLSDLLLERGLAERY